MGEVKSRQEIRELAKRLRDLGEKIVFTNGCFDLLHVGHTRYLSQARALGDKLIVGVNSDDSVRLLKGPNRPITPQAERAEILSCLSFVDYVVVFDEELPNALIEVVRPDFHVKGGDYDITDLPERELVESLGGKVVIVPEIPGCSTEMIIGRLK
ncbi:MAG: D-glycero-beta-D-manno-heptose 1-phosphate adenylyltransferase [Methanobacteriota archaeon]